MIFEHRGESGLIKGEVSLSVFVATKYHDIEQRKKMRNKKKNKRLNDFESARFYWTQLENCCRPMPNK